MSPALRRRRGDDDQGFDLVAESVPDPARFVEIAGWFIVVGATMSLLGFLLPWSRVVIGARTEVATSTAGGWPVRPTSSSSSACYGPRPGHPSAGRPGLDLVGDPGSRLGGLLLGLAWPYLVGPLGADVGLTMITLGGVALLIGGVLALWATRHVEAEPLV